MNDTATAQALSDSLAAATDLAQAHVLNVDARRWPTSGLAWNADGTFLAASHAIEREDDIHIRTAKGEEAKATLVGRDPSLDLAVLKAEVGLTTPTWIAPAELRTGQLLLGLYRPDEKIRARLGLLSGVAEGFHTPGGGKVDSPLAVDISTRSLSALALADVQGRLAGLHVSGFGRGRGLVLTLPTLQRVVAQLQQHGRVRRGYLGVGTQPIRIPEAQHAVAGASAGLLVLGVEPKSPADVAGLSLGDVLVQVAGQDVSDAQELWSALGEDKVGSSVKVKVLRTGKVVELSVTVGERP